MDSSVPLMHHDPGRYWITDPDQPTVDISFISDYFNIAVVIAKRTRLKNRMQMIISPTRLVQYRRVLRELEERYWEHRLF